MATKSSGMPADSKASAKQILNQVKMEAAQEVGVDLKQGYNGDLTSRQAGSIGGQMVKKMIKAYEDGNV
ncbi:MAG: alpha/beta-type small acid-soluble spore protein [Acutalibacteraceae bacterium]